MKVAFIPVRGGSKSIPLKNIKMIAGKPLVFWTVKAACESKYVDVVYVATDSREIKNKIKEYENCLDDNSRNKLNVIDRSAESASDTASTESAMLEFAENYEFDDIVLIQATSPLLTCEDIDKGFKLYEAEDTDSVLSVVRQKRFNWKTDKNGNVHPINYDVFNRPRRQEFDGYLVENGAFYITSRERLLNTKNRVSGNIKAVEMCEESYFEIDEPSDWIIIESLLKKRTADNTGESLDIKMFLTDCDGCLTDGGMYYSENGDELKKFNTKDGMAIKVLRERGIITGLITGENVDLNKRRAEKLKMDIYEPSCTDKVKAVENICKRYNIDMENVCYIGDDINDIELIKIAGFACAPSDAMPCVKEAADFVTKSKGGEGVIREVVEFLLNKKWFRE